MFQINTIPKTLERLHKEGFPVPERALRYWIASGQIPVVRSGARVYILYDNVLAFLTAGSTAPMSAPSLSSACPGIRPVQ